MSCPVAYTIPKESYSKIAKQNKSRLTEKKIQKSNKEEAFKT